MDAELTPQTRKVLDLRFRQKLKYREIATEYVSYTHLDVYKRQMILLFILSLWSASVQAQEFSVAGFRLLPNDVSARCV